METYASEWDKYIFLNFHPPEKTEKMVELLTSEDDERPRIVFLTGEEGIGRGYFLDAAVYEANQRCRDQRFFVARLDFEGFEENTRSLRDFLKYKEQSSSGTAGESFDEKQRFVADLLDGNGKPKLLDAFSVMVLPWLQISLKDLRLWMESKKRVLIAPEREPREAFHVMIEKMCETGAPAIHIANPEMTPLIIRRWLLDEVRINSDLTVVYSIGESFNSYDYAGNYPCVRMDLWRYDREELVQLVDAKFEQNDFSSAFYDAIFRYSQGFPRQLDAAFRSLLKKDLIWQTKTAWKSRPDEETADEFSVPFYQPILALVGELDQEGAELFENFLALMAFSGGIAPLKHLQDFLGLDDEEKEELADIVHEYLMDSEPPCLTDYQYGHPAFPDQIVYGFSNPMLTTIILKRFRWEKRGVAADFLSYLEKNMPLHTRGQARILLSIAIHAGRLDQVETGNRLLAWWSDYESAEELKKQLIEEMEKDALKPETLWEIAEKNEDIWKPIVRLRLLEAYAAQPGGVPWHMRDHFVFFHARTLWFLGRYEDSLREIQAVMEGFKENEKSEILYLLFYWRGRCRECLACYYEAMEDFEKAKGMAVQLGGSRHPHVGPIMNRIGDVYRRMGKYDKALENYRKALDIEMRELGENHHYIAVTLADLGFLYGQKGEYDKALEHCRKSLDIIISIYGENHSEVAIALGKLGSVYEKMGEYEKALEHYRKKLDIEMRIYGENHPYVVITLGNLGFVYRRMGEYEKALKHHGKALNMETRMYGENHPEVANSLQNQGTVYALMGEYEKAKENLKAALDIEMRVLGENHPYVAIALGNLGFVYEQMGEYEKALEHQRKALDIKMSVLGENHPEAAAPLVNLGSVYERLGEYEKALEHHRKALDIMRIRGENHPVFAATLKHIGSVYGRLGEYEKALEHLKKALDIEMRVLGENHPSIGVTLRYLGSVYERMEQFDTAMDFLERSLEILKKVHGESHPAVAATIRKMGKVYESRVEFQDAMTQLHRARQIFKSFLPPKHPDIIEIEEALQQLETKMKSEKE